MTKAEEFERLAKALADEYAFAASPCAEAASEAEKDYLGWGYANHALIARALRTKEALLLWLDALCDDLSALELSANSTVQGAVGDALGKIAALREELK